MMDRRCPSCPVAAGSCLGLAQPGICRRATQGEPSFLASLIRLAGWTPGDTEAELLRGLTCPHQRLCGCREPGYECLMLGSRVPAATCATCLYGFTLTA